MSGLNKSLSNALVFSFLLFAGAIQASNHWDSSAATKDPLADVTHLYAFMNPSCRVQGGTGCEAAPEELILALTLAPSATEDTQFSDAVVYHFYFENDVGVSSQIDCSISTDQVITCAGLNGLSVSAPVGEAGVNGDIRVFAGLRDDPRFIDEDAFFRFSKIGVQAFNPPGIDTIAGSNTLAIVVGIKNSSFPAGSGANDTNGHSINVQKVWVASERTQAAINAGVTGAWFDRELDGQGWNIEMISMPSGASNFLFYFYGYEDGGEQLWLLGLTDDIADSSITVEVLRISGMGFGGNYDPTSKTSDSVGSMTFDFTDCNNASVAFTPSSNDLSAFTSNMQRLTNIASIDCVFFSEGQVDRVGRPGTNLFIPEEKVDAYNTASDPDTWVTLYGADLEASMTDIDAADGIVGNSFNPPSVIAPILADDRLKVDLEWSACHGVWSFELSELVPQPHTNDCGGLGLEDDYFEEFISMVVASFDPLYDDFVTANDVPFLTGFPFLAAPH